MFCQPKDKTLKGMKRTKLLKGNGLTMFHVEQLMSSVWKQCGQIARPSKKTQIIGRKPWSHWLGPTPLATQACCRITVIGSGSFWPVF